MVYKVQEINWFNRIKDDFDNDTVIVKLMSGTVPTVEETYDMVSTSRDEEKLAEFNITLDGAGVSKAETVFTPTATGDITWFKIVKGDYVIATDLFGGINESDKMMWLSNSSLTLDVEEIMYILYIKFVEVS